MKRINILILFIILVQYKCVHCRNKALENFNEDKLRYNSTIGNTNSPYNFVFKIGGLLYLNRNFDLANYSPVWGISGSFGGWINNQYAQLSSNVSLNYIWGKDALGNKKSKFANGRANNDLFFLTYSTYLTFNLFSETNWFYEEINPMYFGHISSIYNSYRNAISLGTTLVSSPKGKYNNITSPRNRSQQLVVAQIKAGPSKEIINSVFINLYEDYLGNLTAFVADMRDRYYTGGGNLQIRVMNNLLLKYFTETYTGNSYIDKQDYPDLLINRKRVRYLKSLMSSKYKNDDKNNYYTRYAYQDPGQTELNKARSMISLEFFGYKGYRANMFQNSNFEFYLGWNKQTKTAWQQNFIHNWFPEKKQKTILDDKRTEMLHLFDYTKSDKLIFLGAYYKTLSK